jgi:hypothetical protein
MVRPRRRGNRLLHLPGISAEPHARALAVTLVVTPRAHSGIRSCVARRSSICFLCSSSCPPRLRVPFYLLLMSHCVARHSSIRLLHMSLGLFVLRVVPLSVSYVRHSIARPFLSPTCESLHCASFIYFVSAVDRTCASVVCCCAHFCFVVHRGRRGEEGGSDSLASWEDKRIDMVASSWRYFLHAIYYLSPQTYHSPIRETALRPTRHRRSRRA